jgi:hypothetical protein
MEATTRKTTSAATATETTEVTKMKMLKVMLTEAVFPLRRCQVCPLSLTAQ